MRAWVGLWLGVGAPVWAAEDLVDVETVTVLEGATAGDAFGAAVDGAGDLDGDGYPDLLVGAPGVASGEETSEGAIVVFHGSAAGIETTGVTVMGTDVGGQLGWSVAGAGDLNGDGLDDLLAGAPYASGRAGVVVAFLGGTADLSAEGPAAFWGGVDDDERFGTSVAAGDVTGDGLSDVIVGAPGARGGAGGVWLYLGAETGPEQQFETSLSGTVDGSTFGEAVASAGDLNGDGYADVAALGLKVDGVSGAVSLFMGSAIGLATEAAIELDASYGSCWDDDDGEHCVFTPAISAAGDVNADGLDDLLVGGISDATATVYFGHADGPSQDDALTLEGEADIDFGGAVAGVGDLDADGEDDVLVGAARDADSAGSASLFDGSATAMQSTASLTLTGTASVGRFGAAAAGAGDVDADGYADLVIGAAGADGDRGAAYLYRGAAGYAAKDEGCGCAAGPRAGAGWTPGLAALALLRRRRR